VSLTMIDTIHGEASQALWIWRGKPFVGCARHLTVVAAGERDQVIRFLAWRNLADAIVDAHVESIARS